jgi:hypothetical protein
MPKVRTLTQGRTKPRYNPKPSARERDHHAAVMECGCLVCGRDAIAHHVMQDCAGKRWRRDHEFVVPLCNECHTGLHRHGSEASWQEGFSLDLQCIAEDLRDVSYEEGIL